MRPSQPPVLYLVGTPKGRLSQLEDRLKELPWQQARQGVAHEGSPLNLDRPRPALAGFGLTLATEAPGMPRQVRIEFPGTIYHVMSRGNRRPDIYLDDVARQETSSIGWRPRSLFSSLTLFASVDAFQQLPLRLL